MVGCCVCFTLIKSTSIKCLCLFFKCECISQEFFLINDAFDALFLWFGCYCKFVDVLHSNVFLSLSLCVFSLLKSSHSWCKKCVVSSMFPSLIHKHIYWSILKSIWFYIESNDEQKNQMRTEIVVYCKNHVQFAPLNRNR